MACPIYKGAGQPNVDSGWLAGLGSWFGGIAPVYAGAKSAPTSSGFFSSVAPTYASAPATDTGAADSSPSGQITLVVPRELLEPRS